MKLRLSHSKYIAHKVAIELINKDFIEIKKDKFALQEAIDEVIVENINKELALDEKVRELLEANEDDIEFYRADERQLFWMAKKRLAKEFDVELSFSDRISGLSSDILDYLWQEYYIDFEISDNQVKNIINNAIFDYLKVYEDIEIAIYEKISNYKRRIIEGSEEYDLVFEKLYEDELTRRGMF
jgi:hypothetical protein